MKQYTKAIRLHHVGQLLVLAIGLLIIFIALSKLGVYLQSDAVKAEIHHAGLWGLTIFIAAYMCTLVIAPLTGFPLLIAAIGAFGLVPAVLLNYSLSLLSAVINFTIARKWGHPFMRYFIGKKGITKVDKLTNHFSLEVLIISRLFQGFLYEWISYAAGLTTMKFKTYIMVTALCSVLYDMTIYLFGLRIHNLGELFISLTLTNYGMMSIPFFYFLGKRVIKDVMIKR